MGKVKIMSIPSLFSLSRVSSSFLHNNTPKIVVSLHVNCAIVLNLSLYLLYPVVSVCLHPNLNENYFTLNPLRCPSSPSSPSSTSFRKVQARPLRPLLHFPPSARLAVGVLRTFEGGIQRDTSPSLLRWQVRERF